MNDNFKKYQDVFIDLTLNNKTIFLNGIDKNNFFDLYNLKKFNENIYFNLEEFVFSDKNNFLKIIDEPIEWQNLKINEIKENCFREKSERLQEIENSLDVKDYNEQKNLIDNFYRNKTNKSLEILNKKYSCMMDMISDLEILNRNFKNKNVYLGYPFVEGYINEKNYVTMPLFLIPIKLLIKNNSWYLEKDLYRDVELNSYLLIILKKIFNGRDEDIKKRYNFKNDFNRDTIYNVLNFLKNYDINLKVDYSFVDSNVEEFSNFIHIPTENKSNLKIRNFMILGNFKTLDDEFFDYESLIRKNFFNNPIFKILYGNSNEDEGNYVNEIGNLYVKNVLDYNQQEIIRCADNRKISIVESPISTGKNTTIFNFALDKILRNKKVLIIFRDSFSMDSIYSKFKDMESIVMRLGECEEESFYERFSHEINRIKTFKMDHEFCNSFELLIDEIREKYSYINKANEVYNTIEKFGLSLQEMYFITMDITNENFDNDSFKKFTVGNPVSGCSFKEIVSIVNKIKDEGIINIFLKNKEYLNKYKIVNFIRDDFDISKCEEFILKLNELKKSRGKIILDIEKNSCSLKVVELFKFGMLSKKEILNEVMKLNDVYEENGEESDGNNSWFKNLSFLKGRRNCKKYQENGKNHDSVKIYYDIISDLIEDIRFLDEILKNDIFNFIKEEIFNFNDITEFINNLIEMLESFNDFLEGSRKLKNLDRVIIDILDYIYNNSLNEEMMRNNLNDILKFSVLINIMRHHHKCGDELMKYKFVNKFIFELKDLFKRRENDINKFVLNKVKGNVLKFFDDNIDGELNVDIDTNYEVREFLENRFEVFLKLFPCVLIEHKDVSSYLPMIEGMFDYVIIDDGHEYFISDVIPHIYRGKQLVIFGDKNQIVSRSKSYDIIADNCEFICDNLLTFMNGKCDSFKLKYLYFDRSEILNNISNSMFKNLGIIKSPDLIKFSEMKNPFTLFKINSQVVNSENRGEGEFVVDLLYDILKNKNKDESVGIVTLTKSHAKLILGILHERLKVDQDFNFMHYNECKKYFGDSERGIYIKSIGDISYDKRDIIIFALGGGFNFEGSFELDFDEISSEEYGESKLNIFMNLPISEMKIVSSFNIDELNFKEYGNRNINMMKDYLNYAKMISIGRSNEVMIEINKSNDLNFFDESEEIISQIQDKLIKKGLNVVRSYGNSSYRFDLAIYNDEIKEYILFIDLDGKLTKRFSNLNERNVDLAIYFEKFGCNVLKLWSKDLWSDFDGQINNIFEVYRSIVDNKFKMRMQTS